MTEAQHNNGLETASPHDDIFFTLDTIQENLFDSEIISTNDDILKLMFSEKNKQVFGVERKRISVVRRVYGTSELALKVVKGAFETEAPAKILSTEIEVVITAVIDGLLHTQGESTHSLFGYNETKARPYYQNNKYKTDGTCELTGEYDKILIVPMRLYKDKSIGAFIIGGIEKDEPFHHSFSRDMDSLSNRVALFMRDIDSQHRRKIQYALNSALNQNKLPSRKEIIECCVQHLTLDLKIHYQELAKKEKRTGENTSQSSYEVGASSEVEYISQNLFPLPTQPWFTPDELDIIVRSPHYFDQFFWLYGEKTLKANNDTDIQGQPINLIENDVAGNKFGFNRHGNKMPTSLIEVFETKRPLVLDTSEDCSKYFDAHEGKPIPKSCGIFPMKIPGGGVIGYFIFKNYVEKRAYRAEDVLLDDISNKVAEIFVKIRHRERDGKLNEFRKVFHENSQAYNEREIYVNKFTSILKEVYGDEAKYALILRNKLTGDIPGLDLGQSSTDLELSESFAQELENESSKKSVVDLARAFIMSRDNDKPSYVKDFIESYLDLNQENDVQPEPILKRSAILPLHRVPGKVLNFLVEHAPDDGKENVNIGCLIIKDAHLGVSDLTFLDSLTNQLALKFKLLDDQDRANQLYAFSEVIHKEKNLTIETLLELVRKYVKKIMHTDNMFVALLDSGAIDERGFPAIRFPLFYELGEKKPEIVEKVEKERFFNPNSNNKGRVEAILESGKAIYIDNLKNSEAWYEPADRQEKRGNPFSSFIGAPIWQKENIVGVIAVYHPDKEYVYGKADLNFLVGLADKASGLLRELKLEEANRQLGESSQAIIQLQDSSRITTLNEFSFVPKEIKHSQIALKAIENNINKFVNHNESNLIKRLHDKGIVQQTKDSLSKIASRVVETIERGSNKKSNVSTKLLLADTFRQVREKNTKQVELDLDEGNKDSIYVKEHSLEVIFHALFQGIFNNLPDSESSSNIIHTTEKKGDVLSIELKVILSKSKSIKVDNKYISVARKLIEINLSGNIIISNSNNSGFKVIITIPLPKSDVKIHTKFENPLIETSFTLDVERVFSEQRIVFTDEVNEANVFISDNLESIEKNKMENNSITKYYLVSDDHHDLIDIDVINTSSLESDEDLESAFKNFLYEN